MRKGFFIRIGTRTTSRKKSAIQAALERRMLDRHLDYVIAKYHPALLYSVREIVLNQYGAGKIIGFSPEEFVDNCIKDAFSRIREYDPKYKFRTFLCKMIVIPALVNLLREAKKERTAIEAYVAEKKTIQDLESEFETALRYALTKQLFFDALMRYKNEEPIRYEVFCMSFYEKLSYPKIKDELGKLYPHLQVESSRYVRTLHEQAIKGLKHYLRQTYHGRKYFDKDLIMDDKFLKRLRAETTKAKATTDGRR
ncbi:MAG: hypothetical protein AB1599_00140 [Planctomycetota bacterium]